MREISLLNVSKRCKISSFLPSVTVLTSWSSASSSRVPLSRSSGPKKWTGESLSTDEGGAIGDGELKGIKLKEELVVGILEPFMVSEIAGDAALVMSQM